MCQGALPSNIGQHRTPKEDHVAPPGGILDPQLPILETLLVPLQHVPQRASVATAPPDTRRRGVHAKASTRKQKRAGRRRWPDATTDNVQARRIAPHLEDLVKVELPHLLLHSARQAGEHCGAPREDNMLVEVGPEVYVGAVDAVKELSDHPPTVNVHQARLEEHLENATDQRSPVQRQVWDGRSRCHPYPGR